MDDVVTTLKQMSAIMPFNSEMATSACSFGKVHPGREFIRRMKEKQPMWFCNNILTFMLKPNEDLNCDDLAKVAGRQQHPSNPASS